MGIARRSTEDIKIKPKNLKVKTTKKGDQAKMGVAVHRYNC